MYQQPHLKLKWAPYHMAPPLSPAQGYFFGPRCNPSILQVPSKIYSLCSPVGPGMNHASKAPATLIPTLMTVHPGGQPSQVVGFSPMNRGPSRLIPQGPHPLHIGTPCRPPVPVGTYNATSGTHPPVSKHKVPGEPNHVPFAVAEDQKSGSSTVATRKRSASPSYSERKQKRQREISDDSCGNAPLIVTPRKVKENQPDILSEGDKLLGHKLSSSIEKLYNHQKQPEDYLRQKMKLRDVLHRIIVPIFPCCGLYIVGSSLTGLATKSSDLDLCLVLRQSEVDQRNEAIVYLREAHKNLRRHSFICQPQIIHAKVPILKFTDAISGVEVDLNVNNTVGIRNTQLICNYSRLDSRVQPLCLLVKLWAKVQDINDPYNKTLSSYSLILMVLHYLQAGCNPPVLPCLHKLMPNHFSNTSDVRSLELQLKLPPFNTTNNQCLGELLLGLFHYYGKVFNFQEHVVSVRTGGILPKELAKHCRSPKNQPSQWNYICIEEPFDRTNTARSVFDILAFKRIQNAFLISLDTLRQTSDLDSILCVDLTSS